MTNPRRDRDDINELLAEMCSNDPRLRLGKMMGHVGIYVGRKMAMFAYDDGLCVRVPREEEEQLLADTPGSRPFMPMGRRMRGWVIISRDEAEKYINHPFVLQAIHLAELATHR